MRDEHPVDRLVVALEGDPATPVVSAMRVSAEQLTERRPWILGPPRLLDQEDDTGTRWAGFGLRLYTALPPWGDEIDPAVDRAHLEEVKELIGTVCRLSADHGAAFQVEFAGEFVGMIESGRMDSGLADTLIGEWEQVLRRRGDTVTGSACG